jgi:hypothetical protein
MGAAPSAFARFARLSRPGSCRPGLGLVAQGARAGAPHTGFACGSSHCGSPRARLCSPGRPRPFRGPGAFLLARRVAVIPSPKREGSAIRRVPHPSVSRVRGFPCGFFPAPTPHPSHRCHPEERCDEGSAVAGFALWVLALRLATGLGFVAQGARALCGALGHFSLRVELMSSRRRVPTLRFQGCGFFHAPTPSAPHCCHPEERSDEGSAVAGFGLWVLALRLATGSAL